MLAATGLSQSGVIPSPSQEQLQEQATQVAASAHSNPEQSDVPLAAIRSQPLSSPTSDNAAVDATQQQQQQQPADLRDADSAAAAAEAAVDNALAAAAAAAAGSLTDDVTPSEAAVASASAAAADTLTADALQEDSSQYPRPLSPSSPLLRVAQEQRQAFSSALAAEGSSTAAPPADSRQNLRTEISNKAVLSPADLQQPVDLTADLAASEAAVDSALAAAAERLTSDAPQPNSRQDLRSQISDNALLDATEEQQAAGLTEDLAASQAAVDSALGAAAGSFTSDVPQLDSRQYLRPLSPGSALLRAAQLQRQAIDNALAAAPAGGDSMRSTDPELSAAEQVHLSNELTRSKAAVEAALKEAREGELAAAAAAAAAADTDWNSVLPQQGQRESALPLGTAPSSQLSTQEASLESMQEDPPAPAAAESAPASANDDSVAFSVFAAPTNLSPMAAERIKAAIAQGAGLPHPTSSSSDPFLAAEDTAAAAAQEAAQEPDQAVSPVKDDAHLFRSLTDAAIEDIVAAAGKEAGEAPSGSGIMPHGQWLSDAQSGFGMGNSGSATPAPRVPQVGFVSPPPAELSQELAADLQEIEALRSQVRSASPLLVWRLVSLRGLPLACAGLEG